MLGNVIALGFFSGGPIFYDLIEESGQFAGLLRTLNETGLAGSTIGRIQENLWEFHISGNEALGSGISAFPSVHVAVATLPVVYLLERRNWFAVPAIGFLAMIQMMSVLTGYHYAVDGYASMAGVAFLWWAFCRTRPAASDERITPQPAASGAAQSS